MSAIPKLHPELELLPIDTSSTSQKYLAKIGSERQFEISETLYDFVRLIDGKRTLEEITAIFSEVTGKECAPADAERIIETYLLPRGLVWGENGAMPPDKQRSYLYLRLSLFSQEMLRPITSLLHFLFTPAFLMPALAVISLFHLYFYLVVERPAIALSSIAGGEILAVFVLLFLSTLFHELGHSSACHHYGARHGAIGVGMYLYFPVFYADVSDVWKLKRTERAVVDFGGMYFQLLLVPPLYVAYILWGSPVFLYTIYALNFSVVASLNPLLRFDGYWLASDLAGVPNLRKRAQEALRSLLQRLLAVVHRSQIVAPLPELHLRPKAKYFLYTYALVSNIFFGFFIYHIVVSLPGILQSYPERVREFLSAVPREILALNFSAVLKHLSSLLFPTLVLVMLGMMLFRMAARIVPWLRRRRAIQRG